MGSRPDRPRRPADPRAGGIGGRSAHVRRGQQAADRRRRHVRGLPQQDGCADGPRLPRPRGICAGGRRRRREPPPPGRHAGARQGAGRLPRGRRPDHGADRLTGSHRAPPDERARRDPVVVRALREAGRLLLGQVSGPARRADPVPRAHRHLLPQLLRDLPLARDRARRLHRGGDQRRARAPRERRRGPCARRPAGRPRRARTRLRLRGRLPLPRQHHLRVRARRRGARARRSRRHARQPLADRRRDPRLHGEGLPHSRPSSRRRASSSGCRSRSARRATSRCSTRRSGASPRSSPRTRGWWT